MDAVSNLDDALGRLADGDRSQFDAVYSLSWPRVRALCLRMEPDEGEDIAQTALLKVFERAAEYDPERPALPWVMGIAGWEVRTWRKKQARRRHVGLPELVDPRDTEDELATRQLVEALGEVLERLRPIDRQTLLAAAGLAAPEVQGATWRKRLQRALERARVAWRREHG
jgi:DNA-directed RNA polymerase specialized sigma24 family protein